MSARRWGKLDNKLHENGKFRGLPAVAAGIWLLTLTWSADNETDGFIPRDVVVGFCRRNADGRTTRYAGYLIAAGLWAEADGGYMIHDFGDYQLTKEKKAKVRTADADRQARHRATRQPPTYHRPTTDLPPSYHDATSAETLFPGEGAVSRRDTVPKSKSKRENPQTTPSFGAATPGNVVVLPTPANGLAITETKINAGTLIGDWIDHRGGTQPTPRVLGQISRDIRIMVEAGINPDAIRRGLLAWQDSGLAPSVLQSFVDRELVAAPGVSTAKRIGSRTEQMLVESESAIQWAREIDAARARGELA